MKILLNGEVIEATDEEMMEFTKHLDDIQFTQTITDKQRISALESAITDIAVMLMKDEK